MKTMAITHTDILVLEEKQDRLDQVLADGELILNRVNARFKRMDDRFTMMEKTLKALEGTMFLEEWKLEKEGVKQDGTSN